MEKIERILVVSRMTMFSRKAIRFGISLANKYNSKLYVMHIAYDSNIFEHWFPVSMKKSAGELMEKAKREIDRIIKAEREGGVDIEEIMAGGDAYKEIMKVVKEKEIDLIILPTHKEGRIEHYLFSRSNDEIIKEIPCSILLVESEPEFV